jgi:hypothetical protein
MTLGVTATVTNAYKLTELATLQVQRWQCLLLPVQNTIFPVTMNQATKLQNE